MQYGDSAQLVWGRRVRNGFSQEEVSMSSVRGGYGGIAIVLLLAVVGLAVLFLAASAAPAVSNGPAGLLARPPVLTGANIPNQYRLHLGPSVALTDLGPTPATASPPRPRPRRTGPPARG